MCMLEHLFDRHDGCEQWFDCQAAAALREGQIRESTEYYYSNISHKVLKRHGIGLAAVLARRGSVFEAQGFARALVD